MNFCKLDWSQDFFALPWSPWRLRQLVVLKHSWPIVMHIQRFHWILVTFRFCLTVHQSNGASKRAFCRMHRKMELCNYHSGQHCSWDCLQMDCAHGPSTQTFRPISLAFRWNLRLFNSWNTLLPEERWNSSRWSLQESKSGTEKLRNCWGFEPFGLKIGCCIAQHFLFRVSTYVQAPEYFQ